MANQIYSRNTRNCLSMSNGETWVFFCSLLAAASSFADCDRHRLLAAWFASRDQSKIGTGLVGFAVGAMPWQKTTFSLDRDFVLTAIDAATVRTGWCLMPFEPGTARVFQSLAHFRAMLVEMTASDIEAEPNTWSTWPPQQIRLCPKHKVYKHAEGSLFCNFETS